MKASREDGRRERNEAQEDESEAENENGNTIKRKGRGGGGWEMKARRATARDDSQSVREKSRGAVQIQPGRLKGADAGDCTEIASFHPAHQHILSPLHIIHPSIPASRTLYLSSALGTMASRSCRQSCVIMQPPIKSGHHKGRKTKRLF